MSSHPFIAKLFDGPIDIVGDIHGESTALESLLQVLGYDHEGRHRKDRRLVFVGDLTDRGPDSVAVAERVGAWVASGRAQCIAGNHELNILHRSRKEGNGWYYHDNHDHQEGRFLASRPALDHHREGIEAFFQSLPLALERADLRVVHACWHAPGVQALRGAPDQGIVEAHDRFAAELRAALQERGVRERRQGELRELGTNLFNGDVQPPLMEGIAAYDETMQAGNPVRALTSGLERRTDVPFYTGGKWRMCERVRWWNEYTDDTPVVFGHYWRWPTQVDRASYDKAGPDVFGGTHFSEWLGPRRSAFCVDYSVGRRYVEIERGLPPGASTRLGALRWPERTLVFETGETLATQWR